MRLLRSTLLDRRRPALSRFSLHYTVPGLHATSDFLLPLPGLDTQWYRLGSVSTFDITMSREQFECERSALINAHYDFLGQYAVLEQALGRRLR